MPLPRAVQEQADAADALMAQMGAVTGAVDPETGEPIQTPAEPAAQTPPEPPAPTPTPAPQEPAAEEWKHKYFTLKGMFDAEVPRLNTQVRELSAQLSSVQGELATLKAATPATPAPAAQTQLITDQDRESFGPDLVSLIERGVRQATEPLQAKLDAALAENARLQQQVGNVAQTSAQTAHAQFIARMEAKVQDLKTLNVDPGFLAWLAEVDPIYGIPRKMALDSAVERKDVERAASIFNAYKSTLAPAAPTPAPKPANELAKQVTPPRTRASAAPTEPVKINWTSQSIDQFYKDLRRGVIPTDEAARLEADLHAAIAEGRVR